MATAFLMDTHGRPACVGRQIVPGLLGDVTRDDCDLQNPTCSGLMHAHATELLEVRPTRLASVESLYAMTIHKARGSQFRSVVVVLPETNSHVLTRELLYTAITRAQTHLTLVASERRSAPRSCARSLGIRPG